MRKLAVLAAVIVAGCAAPAPKEASMDWPAFIAAVPGTPINDVEYKTPALKRSAHRANSLGLEQTKASFGAWCKAHRGKSADMPSLQTAEGGAQSFFAAASVWTNQELVLYGNRYGNTTLFCFDDKSQLTAVMLVRSNGGYRNDQYEPDKLPAPVVALYTPAQAREFADFYNQKEKERALAGQKESQRRSESQAGETRRLRTEPKIGDQTIEGIIIGLRPPLALMQYNATQRQMFGKPQTEWVPISSLTSSR